MNMHCSGAGRGADRNEKSLIELGKVDFSESIQVRSLSTKFVIPLSAALKDSGEPLVYPDGEKQGMPIVNWKGESIGARGIVFRNPVDNCWQAAAGGVIIINEVTGEVADRIYAAVQSIIQSTPAYSTRCGPEQFTLEDTKRLLEEISAVGRDRYNSTQEYVSASFKPLRGEPWGFMQAAGKPASACFLPGPCEVSGVTATPQVFPQGAVFVRDSNGTRAIQPEVFLRTYESMEGARLALEHLPRIPCSKQGAPSLAGETLPSVPPHVTGESRGPDFKGAAR